MQKVSGNLVRCQSPYVGPRALGCYPQTPPKELVVAPVITTTSASGTPAAHRMASSVMAGRLAWITVRI